MRGGDVLHDAALLLALGWIGLQVRMHLLDESTVDSAQAVLPQLLVPASPILCCTCRFLVSRFRVRGAAFLGAAEFVCQLGGRGSGVLVGHVRAQLRHFNIKSELVEDGGHSGLRLLCVVLHRFRIADVM